MSTVETEVKFVTSWGIEDTKDEDDEEDTEEEDDTTDTYESENETMPVFKFSQQMESKTDQLRNIVQINQLGTIPQGEQQYIELDDMNILKHMIGVWLMPGKISRNKFTYLKIELNMNGENGDNKTWRGILSQYELNQNGTKCETCRYGQGTWNLIYPTSIEIRPNIDFICHYWYRYSGIEWIILPKDITYVIGDFVMGKQIFGNLDLIDLKLILDKSSIQLSKIDDETITEKVVNYDGGDWSDCGYDFSQYFVWQIQFRIVDLLTYATDKMEKEQSEDQDMKDVNIEEYNISKLEQFVDENDSKCHLFQKYFLAPQSKN